MRPDSINLVTCDDILVFYKSHHRTGPYKGTRNPLFLVMPNYSTTISKNEVLMKSNEQVY